MSERDTYPPGVPFWVDIAHPDPDAAMRFYSGLFGWEYSDPEEIPGGGRYFAARLRGRDVAGISSLPGGGAGSRPAWKTYVLVDSADATTAKAKRAGGSAVAEPFDAPPGRIALLTDPEGALFCVWEPKESAGAQLVNEPGAWSMSALNTRDPDGAKAFYGAVFGWETEAFDLGGAEIWMWRLDGYVGGEPQQPVPRDVVATMAPLGDEVPAEVPPNWSVDFWVDRVDPAAELVGSLGGAVIAPPYDIPSTVLRQAVVADPHGAAFSITEVTARG
jgi:predicted enzyme related to lactoylglutathione lyase